MIPKDSLIKTVNKLALTYEPDRAKYEESFAKKEEKQAESKMPKDDGIKAAQKTLITWLIEEPSVYLKIKDIIKATDFVEPPFNKVAKMLFEQFESGQVNPASIINRFDSEEEQSEVASLFNKGLLEGLSPQEREKTLNDTVLMVKKNSIDYRNRTVTDMSELMNIMKEQNELSKLHIYL